MAIESLTYGDLAGGAPALPRFVPAMRSVHGWHPELTVVQRSMNRHISHDTATPMGPIKQQHHGDSPMAQTFDLTHFVGPAGRSAWFNIFSLIGPAMRVARAVEHHAHADEADLRALGLKRSDFDRVLAAEGTAPGIE